MDGKVIIETDMNETIAIRRRNSYRPGRHKPHACRRSHPDENLARLIAHQTKPDKALTCNSQRWIGSGRFSSFFSASCKNTARQSAANHYNQAAKSGINDHTIICGCSRSDNASQ
jgi:hypothetical protein